MWCWLKALEGVFNVVLAIVALGRNCCVAVSELFLCLVLYHTYQLTSSLCLTIYQLTLVVQIFYWIFFFYCFLLIIRNTRWYFNLFFIYFKTLKSNYISVFWSILNTQQNIIQKFNSEFKFWDVMQAFVGLLVGFFNSKH